MADDTGSSKSADEELALLRAALPRTVQVDGDDLSQGVGQRRFIGWSRLQCVLDDGTVVELTPQANDEGFAVIDVIAFAGSTPDAENYVPNPEQRVVLR